MTKDDFVEKIENGSDIMFSVSGKQFTILTWMDDGIAIGEQHPNDGDLQYYDTAEDLVERFMIDGKPLGAIASNIKITQYS